MDDYYDDFSDDFGDDFDGNGDSFEGSFDEDFEAEDSLDDDSGIEGETTDEFTLKDGVILGSAMGWAYNDGLEEAKRRKLEKEMNDKTDKKDDG